MRIFLLFLGTLSLAVGIIGIFLPVLPTTPLLLLAAWCYYRGSRRMYHWLMSHPHLGAYIRNFTEWKRRELSRSRPLNEKLHLPPANCLRRPASRP